MLRPVIKTKVQLAFEKLSKNMQVPQRCLSFFTLIFHRRPDFHYFQSLHALDFLTKSFEQLDFSHKNFIFSMNVPKVKVEVKVLKIVLPNAISSTKMFSVFC